MLYVSHPDITAHSFLYSTRRLKSGADWAYKENPEEAIIIETMSKSQEYAVTENGMAVYKAGDILYQGNTDIFNLMDYNGANGLDAFLGDLLVVREAKKSMGNIIVDETPTAMSFDQIKDSILTGEQAYTETEMNTLLMRSAGISDEQRSILILLNKLARGKMLTENDEANIKSITGKNLFSLKTRYYRINLLISQKSRSMNFENL